MMTLCVFPLLDRKKRFLNCVFFSLELQQAIIHIPRFAMREDVSSFEKKSGTTCPISLK
jgi:hypothetical protein